MKRTILIALLFSLTFIFHSANAQTNKRDSVLNEKRVDFAFIPIVSYNRSFGAQIGFMANAYFKINKEDNISPPSMIGTMGTYFYNKTYFAGVFNKNYFVDNKWRTMSALFMGNINFQTYLEIPDFVGDFLQIDDDIITLDYNTKFQMVYLNLMREIVPHFYGGAQIVFSHSKTEFSSVIIPTQNDNLFGFGLTSEFDNRDNVMNPHNGMNIKLRSFSFLESLGSTSEYHKILFEMNKYFELNKHSVLLARANAVSSFGDVPFSGQNVIGRDDLRGYSKGEHRGNQSYNIQSEYRWNFYKKWGMVAFGGLAMAVDNFQGKNFSGILPAAGVGIRYMAIKSHKINIGIDVAKGINDWGLYFRVGEAFAR